TGFGCGQGRFLSAVFEESGAAAPAGGAAPARIDFVECWKFEPRYRTPTRQDHDANLLRRQNSRRNERTRARRALGDPSGSPESKARQCLVDQVSAAASGLSSLASTSAWEEAGNCRTFAR